MITLIMGSASSSRQLDCPFCRRRCESQVRLVVQEKFQTQEDGDRVTRRVLLRESGDQREWSANSQPGPNTEPDVYQPDITCLPYPSALYSQWLPNESLMVDAERDHGYRRAAIKPAQFG
jgi:hypothetical protein